MTLSPTIVPNTVFLPATYNLNTTYVTYTYIRIYKLTIRPAMGLGLGCWTQQTHFSLFASSVNQRLKYDFILSEKDSSFSVSFEVVDPKVTAVLMKSSTLMDHWGLIRGKEIFEQNISSFLALEPPADSASE